MNPEFNKEKVSSIKKQIDECLRTPIDKLLVNQKWGEITFEEAKPHLSQFFKMIKQYGILPIEILLAETLTQIENHIKPVLTSINQIKEFTITGANAAAERTQITNRIKTEIEAFFKVAAQWMPYLAFQRGDIEKNIEQLTDTIKKGESIVDDGKQYIEERKKEIDEIVLATKEAAATKGVAHFTEQFRNESELLATRANYWLGGTIILALLTTSAAVVFYFISLKTPLQGHQLTQLIITKVVILLILFSATIWTGRIYKALKHQESVNKHRANSLKTFQAFVKAAIDDKIRDAVLIETTKAIFGITSSGYLEGQQESHTPSTQIIEMLKGVGGK